MMGYDGLHMMGYVGGLGGWIWDMDDGIGGEGKLELGINNYSMFCSMAAVQSDEAGFRSALRLPLNCP